MARFMKGATRVTDLTAFARRDTIDRISDAGMVIVTRGIRVITTRGVTAIITIGDLIFGRTTGTIRDTGGVMIEDLPTIVRPTTRAWMTTTTTVRLPCTTSRIILGPTIR